MGPVIGIVIFVVLFVALVAWSAKSNNSAKQKQAERNRSVVQQNREHPAEKQNLADRYR